MSTKREALLHAGVTFAVRYFRDPDRSLKQGLAFLSPSEIADHVGCSRSLIYHLWAVEGSSDRGAAFEAYLVDVAEQLTAQFPMGNRLAELVRSLDGESLSTIVRAVAEQEIVALRDEDERALFLSDMQLRAVGADLPRVRDSFNHIDDEQFALLAAVYEKVLTDCDCEMRPPLTYVQLARALGSLLHGFRTEAVLVPSRLDETVTIDSEPWTLLAVAADGIVSSMTQPVR